jgi:hypothetical protein
MLFRQLFDAASGSDTYLLASGVGREAVIIDPVKDQLQQYLTVIADLDLNLAEPTSKAATRAPLGIRSSIRCSDYRTRPGSIRRTKEKISTWTSCARSCCRIPK